MGIHHKVAAVAMALGLAFAVAAVPASAKGGKSGKSTKCEVVAIDPVTGANILSCR